MITDRVREQTALALAGVENELAPADAGEVFGSLTVFTGLVGQHWRPDGRKEFIKLAAAELLKMPGGRVLGALEQARLHVTDGSRLLSFVADALASYRGRLEQERATLLKLNALCIQG